MERKVRKSVSDPMEKIAESLSDAEQYFAIMRGRGGFPIVGLIGNMSGFACPNCDEEGERFSFDNDFEVFSSFDLIADRIEDSIEADSGGEI